MVSVELQGTGRWDSREIDGGEFFGAEIRGNFGGDGCGVAGGKMVRGGVGDHEGVVGEEIGGWGGLLG